MSILFIVPSYKPAYVYGGTIVVVTRLAEQLVLEGHDVSVYTTTANGKTELEVPLGEEVNVDGVKVTYFKRITGDHTHISPALWKQLYLQVKKFDVVHIHSWWNPLVLGAALICKLRCVKVIFSPHGMLSNDVIKTNNAGKKKFIHNLIGKRLLKYFRLHVTAETEWEESMKIIPQWQGHVIPNLVVLPDQVYHRKENKVFTIGFLSRIYPKKGLDVLIRALSKVHFDYKLQIAGDGEVEYMDKLKQLAVESGNDQNMEWVGWKDGEEKFGFLSELDLFALTSYNENFAVVVIESLSVGTPVLLSDKVGLFKYVQERDLGWVTDMDISHITHQLDELYTESNKQHKINAEAPEKIKEEYNDSALAKEYVKFYLEE